MDRRSITLDGTWDFFPDSERTLRHNALEQAPDRRTIQVPGPWQAQFADLRDYAGVAWYRRTFVAPAASADDTVVLHVGAADYHTTVWLNGTCIGEHEGGYLPFDLPLDAAIRAGDNELVLRIEDVGADPAGTFLFQEVPHGKQSWYGPIGGIWQPVRVDVRNTSHLTRLHVTPLLAESAATIAVSLSAPAPASTTVALRVDHPGGAVSTGQFTIRRGTRTAETRIAIDDVRPWSPDSPDLYTITATLQHGETTVDTRTDTFGMRSVATAEGRILLNGEPLYLRGVLDQDYYPDGISTAPADAELDRQFAQVKALGFNCVRLHLKVADPRYYAAADRAGVLVWADLPNWEWLSPAAIERARATLFGAIERDWNHPSIVIWTLVNENWGTDLMFNAAHRQWLADLYAEVKRLDPSRLVVDNSTCFGNFHVASDIEDYHNYMIIPDEVQKWERWLDRFAKRADWTYAHEIDGMSGWLEYSGNPWPTAPRTPTPEVRRRGDEPLIVSEFGTWGLPDVAHLREAYNGDPWWFSTGQEWGTGIVYAHGLDRRVALHGLPQVFGSLAGLTDAAQQVQLLALKYHIESIRRRGSIAGYVMTQLRDTHWESNGVLDMCGNPKLAEEILAGFNADDVLLPEARGGRVAFWGEETCEVLVSLAHHSHADLNGATLAWQLADGPEGSVAARRVQPLAVGHVGTLVVPIPAVEASVQQRLHIRLLAADGTVLARSFLDLVVFPARLSRPHTGHLWSTEPVVRQMLTDAGYRVADTPAAIRVCTLLQDDDRAWMLGGGRVLWLADVPDAQQTPNIGMLHGPREQLGTCGDAASAVSWLRRDGMLADIPTGGLVNWAFDGMIPAFSFTELPSRDYPRDVYAGLFAGWVHKHAAFIADRRMGAGRLLGCTFNVRAHFHDHPMPRVLFNALIRHLVTDAP